MSFFGKLTKRAQEIDSLLCVGLDPHPDDLAAPTLDAIREFCHSIIEATTGLAAAYKPNIAFFEAFGAEGIAVLQQVINSIPNEIPIILDAKRGDIASTAQAYVRAAFEQLGADAITINPYLGHDAVEPFLEDAERGVFLLCKTSNPGAEDLQDLRVIDQRSDTGTGSGYLLYEKVALLAQEWNTKDNLGLVVGATQPEALRRVRVLTPEMWILTPGVGVQGGDLAAALRAGLRSDGLGMLMPISRAISRADDPKKAASEIRKKINQQRNEIQGLPSRTVKSPEELQFSDEFAQLADGLLHAGCIKFGQFTLKSGMISPIYVDLRLLVSYPNLLQQVGRAYLRILKRLTFDRLAGLPYAALPIATVVSIQGGWPLIYPRKEVKTYGTKAEIEGNYKEGERIVVIDDLVTTGESKFESIDKLISAGMKVEDVVVLIDRQSGASEALAKAGYQLHSVSTLTNLLNYYEVNHKMPREKIQMVREFLQTSQ
jgi:uridine monophosphate synthetase